MNSNSSTIDLPKNVSNKKTLVFYQFSKLQSLSYEICHKKLSFLALEYLHQRKIFISRDDVLRGSEKSRRISTVRWAE